MGNALFVVWRESLEAFLIAGILYAWLKGNDATGRGRRALFIGLAAGVGLAVLLGWALLRLSLIHISEPTRPYQIPYAAFCLKKNRS